MNLDSFSTVIDDRRYMKPEVYVDESNAFIENLRNTQGQRNEQIAQDTYNLGTAVPSNLGGLGGSSAYFNARYQTPYTNAVVADLRATAQAQALNEAMNNTLAQAKEKYNKAYKAYQRRQAIAKGKSGGGGKDSSDLLENANGVVDYDAVDSDLNLEFVGSGTGKNYDNSVTSDRLGVGNTLQNRRTYYMLGNNGRTPIAVSGSGSSVVIDTPTQSYIGKDAANNYVKSALGNGKKILQVGEDGKITDVSGAYHSLWGI